MRQVKALSVWSNQKVQRILVDLAAERHHVIACALLIDDPKAEGIHSVGLVVV